jgi:hypothetical protein
LIPNSSIVVPKVKKDKYCSDISITKGEATIDLPHPHKSTSFNKKIQNDSGIGIIPEQRGCSIISDDAVDKLIGQIQAEKNDRESLSSGD